MMKTDNSETLKLFEDFSEDGAPLVFIGAAYECGSSVTFGHNKYNNWINAINDYISQLTKEKEALEARVNPWVSVDDRLPEESGIYLACSTKDGRSYPENIFEFMCAFDAEAKDGESKWQHSSGFYDNGITHWLNIPSPPKEGE
ncbi:MAG: DUF551 domain-containing protein [bacterium]|nr:DUF551 domain-containing protein [bacterium]